MSVMFSRFSAHKPPQQVKKKKKNNKTATTTTTTTTKKILTAKLLVAFASRGDAALQPVRVPQIPPEAAKEGKERRECGEKLA